MKNLLTMILMLIFIVISNANDKQNNIISGKVDNYTPGYFVVKFKKPDGLLKKNTAAINEVVSKYNVVKQTAPLSNAKNEIIKDKLNLDNVYVFQTSIAADINNIVKELSNRNDIEYAEPLYRSDLHYTPDDPLYSQLYHLPQIKAADAWDVKFGSSDVIIAVIDSGVDWDHEDLESMIWQNPNEIPDNGIDDDNNGYIDDVRGWDFISDKRDIDADPNEDFLTEDNDPMDYHGHGTHVAGIAGASSNNGVGIASASGGANIMPLRTHMRSSSGTGTGYSDWFASAYIYAADNGAHITNLSSGSSGQLVVDAAFYAFLNGVLVVTSAGNSNSISPSVIAAQDWSIAVASVNQNDVKTYYSSYGDYVKVSAPGGEQFVGNDTWGILSTVPYPVPHYNGAKYTKFQGTSMASPLVASLAALIKSNQPDISVVDLFSRITGTTDNIDASNPDFIGLLGAGRVNANKALTQTVSAEPNIKVISTVIEDAAGNNNGFLDPGETVTLKIKIRNTWKDADNLSVRLIADSEAPLNILSDTYNAGDLRGALDFDNSEALIEFTLSADAGILPQTLEMILELNGSGFSQDLNYRLAVTPAVLFIGDFESENGYFDFTGVFISSLKQNRISFDYVHKNNFDIDLSEQYKKYQSIIWGCEWAFPTLDADDRQFLTDYLQGGGSLFISGQDIGWDLNENTTNADVNFFENYLKARYVADVAGASTIYGIQNDVITDGLQIDFLQEKRSNAEQFPDVVEPIGGAVSLLNYSNGTAGAVRYSGDYRLVYFAFGGFEAVTDDDIKNILMIRIVNWLSGINFSLEKLPDTENMSEEIPVIFRVEPGSKTINESLLYWKNNDEESYNKIIMQSAGNGNYTASIPSQSSATVISYLVYAAADDGSYIITEEYSFNVGPDQKPPEISLIGNPLRNSVNIFGPQNYQFRISATDNIGLDYETIKLNHKVNDGTLNSVTMNDAGGDIFTGSFSYIDPLNKGDKISYFFTGQDISANQNIGTSDTFYYFIDTIQVIDDFEFGLSDWELGEGWGLANRSKSGVYSISDSPDGFYPNDLNSAITYLIPFNLSVYKYAEIEFFMRANLERDKDSLFLELSADNGNSWQSVLGYSASSTLFKQHNIDISEFTGEGNEEVRLRFRLQTDSENERDGVWIDDISIIVSFDIPVSADGINDNLPEKYSLEQNYPNPFNPTTVIKYSLPFASKVKIKITNILGQEIAELVNKEQNAGYHQIEWIASGIATGIYFYSIEAQSKNGSETFSIVKKMLLLK